MESQLAGVRARFAKPLVPQGMRIVFSTFRHSRGYSSMAEPLSSKQKTRVRFSLPAPITRPSSTGRTLPAPLLLSILLRPINPGMSNTPGWHKNYYKTNQRRNEYVRDRLKHRKREVQELKLKTGCANCGYNRCAGALQYHHPNADKEHNVARMAAQGRSLKSILNEISKCVLLCANCHCEEHERRGTTGRSSSG